MPTEPRRDPVGRALAWFCALSNLAAAVATATLVRDGTASNPDFLGRIDFLLSHTGVWQFTWLLWMLAALGLLAFLVALYRHARTVAPTVGHLALVLAGAGLALDIANDSLIAFLLPWLASDVHEMWPDHRPATWAWLPQFEAWERATIVIGVVAANGLYTAAGWIFEVVSFRLAGFPRWVALLGLAPWTAGSVMAVRAALGQFHQMEAAATILMPSFCLWVVAVAEFYFARRLGGAADHAGRLATPAESAT